MKIQLALDHTSLEAALPLAMSVGKYVDIIEIGTPLLKTTGLYGVKIIRSLFPNHILLVDSKTMDAGEYEATPFLEAGADIVTVLGAADLATIKGVIKAANNFGAKAQVDLINTVNKQEKFLQFARVGAHIIGIHTGIDQQLAGMTPFKDLESLSTLRKEYDLDVQISVAGGIKLATLPEVIEYLPHIVVVGGGITSAQDPLDVAQQINNLIPTDVM